MDDLKNWLPIDTYNAVRLNKYNDIWSIMLGSRGDSDTYDKWCNPLKYQNGKNVPVKKKDGDLLVLPFQIPLGDKEKALKILQNLMAQLKAMK